MAINDRELKEGPPPRRRAGLRPDERDPDEPYGEPGSAGGEANMAGTPAGGLASGGLAGTNAPSGSTEGLLDELSDGFGVGIDDVSGNEEVDGGPPYVGHAGGAVGGTPAEKRAEGGRVEGGLDPVGDLGDDRTLGSDPYLRKTSQDGGTTHTKERPR